jgi:hypothetical protein
MMLGLRTVWLGAVGTGSLALAVGAPSSRRVPSRGLPRRSFPVVLTLRGLRGRSVRSLLARAPQDWERRRGGRRFAWALALGAAAALLLGAGLVGRMNATAAFFGAGALLLGASLLLVAAELAGERPPRRDLCPWRAFARSDSGSRPSAPAAASSPWRSSPSRRS